MSATVRPYQRMRRCRVLACRHSDSLRAAVAVLPILFGVKAFRWLQAALS